MLLFGAGLSSEADSGASKSSGSRWGADYFPNVPLVTHEGDTVHFFDDLIEGKVVVINFIYTHCTDVCPVDTARLKSIQELLGDRVGKDIFMYSISIDPERDTPEVLAEYVKRYRIGPGWLFLAGKEEDVLLLRKKLGLYMAGLEEGLLPHHRSIKEDGEALNEERRLCYVGITRAKKQLVLSYAQWRRRRHERIKREKSQFLPDIPKEALAPLLSDIQTEDETAFAAFSALKNKFSKTSQNGSKEVEGP